MDRIFFLLRYLHGHLLLQYMECQPSSTLASVTAVYSTCIIVSRFSDVVHLDLFRQRIGLSSIGCVRSSVPAQRNRAAGGRSPSFDGLERMEQSCFESSGMSKSFCLLSDLSLISLEIGGLVAHVILFWGPYAVDSFKLAYTGEQPDVHYQVNLIAKPFIYVCC